VLIGEGVVNVKRAVVGEYHVVVEPFHGRRGVRIHLTRDVDRLAEPSVAQSPLMNRKPRLVCATTDNTLSTQ